MNIIVSDGSYRKIKSKKFDAVSGSGTVVRIPSKKKEVEKSVALPDSTNNYAELYAIYEGLKTIEKHSLIDEVPLLIITDSKYAITVLTDTMIYEGRKGIERQWKTKDGSPLKNEKLIKKIYKIITDKDGELYKNIKFVHINSHLKKNNNDHLDKIVHKFAIEGISIDRKMAAIIIELNDRADRLANEGADQLLI